MLAPRLQRLPNQRREQLSVQCSAQVAGLLLAVAKIKEKSGTTPFEPPFLLQNNAPEGVTPAARPGRRTAT